MEQVNVIYGAGKTGYCVYKALKEEGIKIDYFADNFKDGNIEGIPIIKPGDISNKSNIFFGISYNFPNDKKYIKYIRKYVPEIIPNINLNKTNKILFFDKLIKRYPKIIDYYIEFFIMRVNRLYAKDKNEKLLSYKDEIKKYLKDKKSKILFEKNN